MLSALEVQELCGYTNNLQITICLTSFHTTGIRDFFTYLCNSHYFKMYKIILSLVHAIYM